MGPKYSCGLAEKAEWLTTADKVKKVGVDGVDVDISLINWGVGVQVRIQLYIWTYETTGMTMISPPWASWQIPRS